MNSKNGTTQSNEGPHSQQSSGQVRICLSVNAYKQNVSKLNTIQDTGPIKIILDHHSQLGLTHLGCFMTTHWFVFVSTHIVHRKMSVESYHLTVVRTISQVLSSQYIATMLRSRAQRKDAVLINSGKTSKQYKSATEKHCQVSKSLKESYSRYKQRR